MTRVRGRLLAGLGWTVAGGLSAMALARLARWSRHPVPVATQSVTAWALLPAYPLAAAALVGRRRSLAAVAAVAAVGHAYWTGGARASGRPQAAPTGSAVVHLVTANVLAGNPDVDGLARDLLDSGADVLNLQEITPQLLDGLREAGLLDKYPHHVLDALPGYHGSVILSQLPIDDGRAMHVAGWPMTIADLRTAAGPLRLVNVHVVAPLSAATCDVWCEQLAELPGLRPTDGTPFVLAGDFNATTDHGPFARLLTHGLRDAFLEAGRGLGATWPQWKAPSVPVMRLDHVLVSETLAVLDAEAQPNHGSDHRRVSVTLAVPARR